MTPEVKFPTVHIPASIGGLIHFQINLNDADIHKVLGGIANTITPEQVQQFFAGTLQGIFPTVHITEHGPFGIPICVNLTDHDLRQFFTDLTHGDVNGLIQQSIMSAMDDVLYAGAANL